MLETRLGLAYLAAAREEAGPKTIDSRISALTGLQRRDIARLRNKPVPRSPIVNLWRKSSHIGAIIPIMTPKVVPPFGKGPSCQMIAPVKAGLAAQVAVHKINPLNNADVSTNTPTLYYTNHRQSIYSRPITESQRRPLSIANRHTTGLFGNAKSTFLDPFDGL